MPADSAAQFPIPPHVPPELVGHFPFGYGATTDEIPWKRLVPDFCKGPDIIYAPNVMHSGAPGWVPRRAADLRAIYLDAEHFTSAKMAPFAPLIGEDWLVLPLEGGGDDHARYRMLLNPMFGPKSITGMESRLHGFARAYAESFRDRGHCDVLKEFTTEFPIRVFLDLMGMPQERVAEFLKWEEDLLHSPDLATLQRATKDVSDYLRSEIQVRRKKPGEDLITVAVAANKDGKLSEDEILGICFNLFIGGMETVSTNSVWQFYHLATHPEHQRQLRADPSLLPGAVEEMLRFYASVMTMRTCIKEVQIAGVTMMPGDFVAMTTALGAHDDREYENPEEIRFDRHPRALSFGSGRHLCLGAHLARREMRIALQEFLDVIPEFRLQEGAKIHCHLHTGFNPDTMPLVWNV
ncbi:MAG: cytochrome P450 [Caulobacterales bacterium]